MDLDLDTLTPPGSPILGHSRSRDFTSSSTSIFGVDATAGIRTFSCKGPVCNNDSSFSSDGYFRQDGLSWAIETVRSCDTEIFSSDRSNIQKDSCTFFGFYFDPTLEDDLVALLCSCRKRINLIEIMSSNYNNGKSTRNDENAFGLRLEFARVSKFLLRNRLLFTNFDTRRIFNGLILTLGSVKEWPTSLQLNCGSLEGNECTSPAFHLFHLHWELRWTLLVFFKLRVDILNWIMDDLLQLSFLKFKNTLSSNTKSAFNCYCVMEFWTMLRILVEEVQPGGNSFTELVKSRIGQMVLNSSDLFPIWLTYNLSQLTGYEVTGEWNPALKPINEGNDLHQILKQWLVTNANGSGTMIIQVHSLVRDFLPNIGYDLTFISTLWFHWLLKLDKGYEVRNMDHYSSPTKWLRLVTRICDMSTTSSMTHGHGGPHHTNSLEPFHTFLILLVDVINHCSVKDWRKLVASICGQLTLTPKIVESLGENGLTRMITLFLSMASVGKSNIIELCQRLNDLLNFAKESLCSIKFRGRSAMVLLFLRKSLPIGKICGPLMKSVDKIMGTIHRSSVERDMIMIYWDLIQNLPQVSPHSELEQSKLISVNLNPWLASCGPNYLVRTLRILHSIFDTWILNTNSVPTTEKSSIARLIVERTDTFIHQSVVGNLESIDVEPFADVAVDFTVYQKLNRNYTGATKIFERCALSSATSSKISEIYLMKLIDHREVEEWDNSFVTELQLSRSWIRLIIIGGNVPYKLTTKILSAHTTSGSSVTVSTGNDMLLRGFLNFVNSSECYWTNSQLSEILSPVMESIKITIGNGYDADTVESIVSLSVLVMEKAPLSKIYARNAQSSLVLKILEGFVPPFLGKPPWEKLSPGLVNTLKNYLHQIFIFISSKDWSNDAFFKRKLCDTFRFAFLGFITTGDLEEGNPGLLIMRHIEDQPTPEPLLKELMSSLQQLLKEDSLMKRFLLAAMGFLKQKMILTSVWLFGLILELMMETNNEVGVKCSRLLSNCILLTLTNRDTSTQLTNRLRLSLEVNMTKHFSLKSKRFFDLLNMVVEQGGKRPVVLHFIQKEIMPLVRNQVENSEMKQGGRRNGVMREHLQVLGTNLTKGIQLVKAQRSV